MWLPIKNAPKDRTQILIRFHGVPPYPGLCYEYTSDVYHSWWDGFMQNWSRWPFAYEPSHFMLIPTEYAEG